MSYQYKKEFNRKRLTDLENKRMVARGEQIVRKPGMVRYTLLYLKWITNKDLLCSIGNSAQCYVAAGMVEGLGEWITCIYIVESLHYSPETITTSTCYVLIIYVLCACAVFSRSVESNSL